MNCTACGARLSTLRILGHSRSLTCPCRETTLRVSGYWFFVLVPMIFFFLVPFAPHFQSTIAEFLFLALLIVLAYVAAFLLFVRVVALRPN
jgi:hypothetical protein